MLIRSVSCSRRARTPSDRCGGDPRNQLPPSDAAITGDMATRWYSPAGSSATRGAEPAHCSASRSRSEGARSSARAMAIRALLLARLEPFSISLR